ncbi:ankyrin repeat-containing protein BDA1-like [Rhododendron vialii]|uniref:ankyrin repeat-containing protein BDA1-like n=1 Tax=Rhododendron vialii TaxID=182163 RepID=UPI00265E3D45|nr:ankyrin repeat-containing protein BDA1-like [Rhododendron vialii]
MEQRLCEAAIRGHVESLPEIRREDALILDKIVVGCFNGKSPLHIATSCGKAPFVNELLRLKPELAEVLDSDRRSALHLASAKGHAEIVKALANVSPDMCLLRDRDGNIPLHIAAAKGKVDALDCLLRTCRRSARVRLDRDGSTVLHLCVKHDKLNTLKLLLELMRGEEFVNAKDNDGNTILHLAVLDQQLEIIMHVLKNSKIDVNAKNASGHTALDILFLADEGSESKDLDRKIEDFLREAKAKRAKDLVHSDWLTKKRDALMIVASLIATMAFQAGVNPPGGVWQGDLKEHKAGEAVMASNFANKYLYFLRSNTIGFVASLSTILLLISGLPFKRKGFMWILVMIMWLAITSMAFSYAFANIVITPKKDRDSLSKTITIAVIVWCGVMALNLLVPMVRCITGFLKERRRRTQAIDRISSSRRPQRTPSTDRLNGANGSHHEADV